MPSSASSDSDVILDRNFIDEICSFDSDRSSAVKTNSYNQDAKRDANYAKGASTEKISNEAKIEVNGRTEFHQSRSSSLDPTFDDPGTQSAQVKSFGKQSILDSLGRRSLSGQGSSEEEVTVRVTSSGSNWGYGSGTTGSSGVGTTGSYSRNGRGSNLNIRAPQGIPGRDGALVTTRKAFINPSAGVGGSIKGVGAEKEEEEEDVDTNPLRRLRDSQVVVAPRQTSALHKKQISTDSQPPCLPPRNLNANFSFFDKLKEQEQQRM